jgi:hypothetical protein
MAQVWDLLCVGRVSAEVIEYPRGGRLLSGRPSRCFMLTSPLNSARGRPAAPVGGDPLLHPKGGVVKLEMMQKQLLRAEAAAEMESAVCRGDLAAFETRLDHWRGVRPQMTMSSRRSIMLSMPDPDVTRPARIVPIMFSASR